VLSGVYISHQLIQRREACMKTAAQSLYFTFPLILRYSWYVRILEFFSKESIFSMHQEMHPLSTYYHHSFTISNFFNWSSMFPGPRRIKMRAYATKCFSSSTFLFFLHFVVLFFITSLVLVSCRSLLAPFYTPHVCRRGQPTSSLDAEKRRVSILHDERETPSPTAFFNEVFLSSWINLLKGTKSCFISFFYFLLNIMYFLMLSFVGFFSFSYYIVGL